MFQEKLRCKRQTIRINNTTICNSLTIKEHVGSKIIQRIYQSEAYLK